MKQLFTKKNGANLFISSSKKFAIAFAAMLLSTFPQTSRACSPLTDPSLLSYTVVGNDLILNFQSNTIYTSCQYYVDIEFICNNASFSGLGPFYQTATITKTASPQAFPTYSLNLSQFCPGSVYKFRFREVNPPSIFGNWSTTYTMTTPGIYQQPNLTITGTPSFICVPSNSSSVLNATVTNACGANSLTVYSWSPPTGLNATNISNPVASPTSNITYTCVVSNTVGCWTVSNTISFLVNSIPMNIVATPSAICVGSTASLTVGGAATSYTWSTGSNQQSITVAPSVSTIYTVIGSNSNGCTNTVAVNLIVNSTVPVLSITSSSNNVCQGGTLSLSGNGALSYSWAGNVINAVPFVPPGTNTYVLTGYNACGSSTLATSVTVNPAPPVVAIASTPSLCSGTTATLVGGGANSYVWANGIVNGGSFMPMVTSGYTVTGFSAFGCTATAATTITVVQTPTDFPVAAPPLICIGSTANISASGAQNYTWSPGGSNLSSIIVSPTITTVYTVTKTNGVCSDIKSVTLTVNNLPFILALTNPTVVCSLKQVTLNAGGAQTYTWAPFGGIGNGITVTPTVTTIFTVTGHDGTCVNTGTVLLNVLPNPTITIAPTASVLCLGECATVAIGGASTYTWIPGNVTGTNVNLCPTTTTSYSVSGTNSVGCTTGNSQVIVVNPVPSINLYTNKPMVCDGQSSTLTVNGANSYSWAAGGSGTMSIVNPTATSVYSVTGYYGGTGCNITNTVQIVVFKPNFTVPATASSCIGGTVTLTASGADSYTWNGNFQFPTIYVSPTVYTIFQVSATSTSLNILNNPVSCISSKTVGVSIYNNPAIFAIPSKTAICKNESATITGSGAVTYSWSTLQTGTSIVVSPIVQTNYSVTGADANGCKGTANVNIKVNQCTGLAENEMQGLSFTVYPNPNSGEFIISAPNEMQLKINDELGRTVRVIELNAFNENRVVVKELAAGLYFIGAVKGKNTVQQKLVVNK